MPPKTKIKLRRSRPAVRFTVRRIANKNPRQARAFRNLRKRLARVTAGLLACTLLASSSFLGGKNLKSDLNAVTPVATENTTSATCTAPELAKNFTDLTTQLADLSRGFPETIDNLDFCTKTDCAAEKQIYDNETQIWKLEKELTELRTREERERTEFLKTLSSKEDGVLFCENDERCTEAETELQTARDCEKEFQTTSQLFESRQAVEEKYAITNAKNEAVSAATYVKKLMEDVFKNRDLITDNKKLYEQCVAASDASVCQKYNQRADEAQQKVASTIAELGGLQIDLGSMLDQIETDIVALEIGKKDPKNFAENEGLGWCDKELQDKKAALSKKVNSAVGLKAVYDAALANLRMRKVELKASLQTEIEEAAMHAAAEKEAAEAAAAAAAAEQAATAKRTQAGIIFGIWSLIRNSF
ncbi:MAG: hypothetical protein V1936_02805 [Patescibacteria group bacterium]